MPLLNDDTMETHQIGGSNFSFSAKRIGDLGASEYTGVVVVVDKSGSVAPFQDQIEACVKSVAQACRRSPRADNLLLRVITFSSGPSTEIHGFLPLSECNTDRYTGKFVGGGMTALYDAAFNGIESLAQYGRELAKNDFTVNGIVVVLTDGEDNMSVMTEGSVKEAIAKAVQGEALESLITILVGVNVSDPGMSAYLDDFHARAGFTQYVEIEKADEKTLAKLGAFISKSVSSQSQALGTGGPSKALSF